MHLIELVAVRLIDVHLDEVESTVEIARELRHVDIEGELLVLEVEQLLGAVVIKQVDTRSNVLARALGSEVQAEGAT